MKRIWILVAGFVVGSPFCSAADSLTAGALPKVEESSRDADKAALQAAASEADQWAASHKTERTSGRARDTDRTEEKPVTSTPPVAISSAPAVSPAPPLPHSPAPPVAPAPPAAPPIAPRSGLNEMKGKLESKSYDPKTIRLTVDGGYNVEFAYDGNTQFINGGSAISVDDLEYGDGVIVRYEGKELLALQIDRVSKAPRPQ